MASQNKKQNGQIDAPWVQYIEKMDRDQILKEAFESPLSEKALAISNQGKMDPQPETTASGTSEAVLKDLSFKTETEEGLFSFVFSPAKPLPFPSNELLTASTDTYSRSYSHFSLPAANPLNLLEHLPKDLILSSPAAAAPSPAYFPPVPLSSEMAFKASSLPHVEEAPTQAIAHFQPILRTPRLSENAQLSKAPPLVPVPTLPRLPTLADLETASYSDSFEAELIFLPREEGSGYIFAITLIPRSDLNLPKIRQNYTFLIDRSNSIQKDRLAATKNAVHKALEELSGDDKFNIVAFESKMEKLSPVPLSVNPASLAKAEGFLENIQLGSFFSSGDVYKPLVLTVPGAVDPDEVYTAILLTDGESLAKKNLQRSLLFEWTSYNQGKVALFVLGMNGDAHLSALDSAAAFNKGKLTSSPTHRGLKRKLLKLMKTIGNPIAKNLNCKAISRSSKGKIELFPKQNQMAHLYLDQPYVILGSTDTLDDFILFIQARLKNRWINIKKTISFLNAKKGSQSLRGEWALQQAYRLYESFAHDGDSNHLAEAGKILEPFGYKVAIQ